MGFKKNWIKTMALFLATLLFLQSCVAYHTTSSLEQASKKMIRTKVKKTDGKIFKFRYITLEDGQYYGMNRKSGEWIKTPIKQEDIAKVFTENKGITIFGTTALTLLAIYGIGILFYAYD
jgi:hypothetical protein